MACATGASQVGTGSDGGVQPGGPDGSYGAEAGPASDAGAAKDSGSHPIGDSGGGGGGGGTPLVTDGGDCIGDPGAPFGYDFACELGLSFDPVGTPCEPGMNQCDTSSCCFVDPAAMCYADNPDASTQCVPLGM